MRRFRYMPLVLALTLTQGLHAQQDDGDEEAGVVGVAVTEEEAATEEAPVMEEKAMDEIVVTGSRIRRDEFSTAAPVQIIDGQASRELGLIDTAALLQGATQATGMQIDSTFTNFVVDNGPGASQINLRGLGAERVLILLNSRRLAPGGVGGAPTSPDLSTIPNVMVDRIEFLLDGASSIYGSDAVGGVVNVIMKKDFEGLQFESEVIETDAPGGEEQTLGIAWGKTADNWTFGVAAEYYRRQRTRLRDRAYTEHCNRYLYEDENGNPLSDMLTLVPGTTISPCRLDSINRVYLPAGFGNIWYTPGETNIGIPNFSETEVNVAFVRFNPTAIVPLDVDGDGVPETGLIDPDGNGKSEIDLQTDAWNQNLSERNRTADLVPGSERVNFFAYGEYDLGNASNTQAYFEVLHANRKTVVFTPGSTIFPEVPATNPYNPCNQSQPNGVNCLGFYGVNFGSFEATPIVVVREDRDTDYVDITQIQAVGGLRGDLPGWRNNSGFGNWGYDFYFSYARSNGTHFLTGILEHELTLSLETSVMDPVTGEITCGNGQPCVPVNMFAGQLYQPGGGSFATPQERDFVFGERAFDTSVYQSVFSGILQGDLALLPWNNTSVPLVLGFEWREDEIDSIPNDVARDGLIISFFKDAGAVGKRNIRELFLETELQLLEEKSLAEELSLNLALRWTEESTYGSDTTYSVKSVYRPVTGITFRGTYGTSFRAPNAHEQFLAGTSGFATVYDPCVVPTEARIDALDPNEPATYDPDADWRAPETLDNCRAQGVDPVMLGLDGSDDEYSVERIRKGGQQVQLNIDPETSTSYTYGVVLDQPFWESFILRASATYYDVHVEDTISLLNTGFIIWDCYVENPDNTSPFCRFVRRGANGLIEEVDASFININGLTSRGIDYNLYLQRSFVVFDRNLNLELDLGVTRLLESSFIFGDDEIDDAGIPTFPEWEGEALLWLSYGNVRLNWRSDYTHGGEDDPGAFFEGAPCYALGVLCRPIARTHGYWTHTASVTWRPRDWSITLGVANLFDKDPFLLDQDAPGTQWQNLPLGTGYDYQGRRAFLAVARQF